MSENWKIQISPKLTDGTLINLRAETPDEAERILTWAIENAPRIGEAMQAVNAVSVVAASFPGAQVVAQTAAPQAAPQQQPQGQWAQPQQAGPSWSQQGTQQAQQDEGLIPPQMCAHGPMKLQRSKPGAARDWVAYMCPTAKGTPGQCKPVDAKTGKTWG